jgi:HD-GYP domain-containing protein (c-di-GMP phosphodiesterase class II)
MSETQALLSKIASLRQRLEQGQGTPRGMGTPAGPDENAPGGLARLWELERQVNDSAEQAQALDAAVRPATAVPEKPRPLPSHLTSRARKVLEKGRELLQALKLLNCEPLLHEPGGLLAGLYRETTVLAEAAFRLVTQLPDSPGGQMQMCEGIEALMASVSQRLGSLAQALRQQRTEQQRLMLLAGFLDALEAGSPVDLNALTELSEALLDEAAECAPLRFYHAPPPAADRTWVTRLVAGHGLSVAQVMARLVRHEPETRGRAVEAVLAALLHDAGMLRVPPEILAQAGPLDDDGKRAVERHCHEGGELVGRLLPGSAWLIEAAKHHHERLDGTGYPDGLRGSQLSAVTRLLAVCDVYAAGCQARAHRGPRDTRTALTDALLLADQEKLDRRFAERLLQLSFYPVGSVVEMADGALAGVVAASSNLHDLHAPARPVVALLTDSHGRFLPSPRYLDLSHSDTHSVVRTLVPAERRQHLGTRYPEWAL